MFTVSEYSDKTFFHNAPEEMVKMKTDRKMMNDIWWIVKV